MLTLISIVVLFCCVDVVDFYWKFILFPKKKQCWFRVVTIKKLKKKKKKKNLLYPMNSILPQEQIRAGSKQKLAR